MHNHKTQDWSRWGDKKLALDYIFHPRSIAVVGASSDPNNWIGQIFLRSLISFGFEGRLYPVNPKADEIMGLKAYPNVRDIPGPVDHVICSIPAPLVPQLIEDCVAKGVKVVHMFTAGFSETGEEEGIQLEAKILELAKRGGIRLIGPNCMGLYCPGSHISFEEAFPKESGTVGFFSQSGGNASELVNIAALRGIRFSKVISYGNAVDLNEADFLEYFIHDPETKIIAAYIEGVKNGRRFVRLLREAAQTKPTIVLKGGRTQSGAGAVASHTGSLAGADEVFDALCRQMGVIRVYSLEELADVIQAFLYMPPPKGCNVGVIGGGGGASVQAADDCDSAGLPVPPLPPEIRKELRKFTPPAGTSIRNPVDTMAGFMSPQYFEETIRLVASYERIDLLITHLDVDFMLQRGQEQVDKTVEALLRAGRACNKPMAVVILTAGAPEVAKAVFDIRQKCLEAGFPVYPTIARAAQAISKLIAYNETKQPIGNDAK